ncbi:MAG: NAD-dependent epimerase/dehydratase family protein [Crocinitomix sp.]|nr:NAD-dependent epimerase/dehydratase family protein [Crocinitomix sp.]
MLNIHITGANGGVGSALSNALVQTGAQLIPVKNPAFRIQEDAYFEQFDNPEEIDLIYHLAAISFVPDSWENPARFIEVNVLGTTKVLEFCRKYNIRLVYVSSYAYGAPQYLPIDEKHPVSASNPYGLSKIMGEELCTFYGDHYDLSYLIVRPFNVYGTLKNTKLLIPEIIAQIEKGDRIQVKDLVPKRDCVFIDDLIGFLLIAGQKTNNEIYNVGGGESFSVAEIIEICQNVWGTNLPVESAEVERKNEIPETLCDNSKAKTDLGWSPQFTFQEGIAAIKQRLKHQSN